MASWTNISKPNTTLQEISKPSPLMYPTWSQTLESWSEIDETWSNYQISIYVGISKPSTTYSSIPKPL